jgi:alanyl-tRNA synthetase
MKITYNFGILKNKLIGIELNGEIWFNVLKNFKQNGENIFLKFENSTLQINCQHFLHMKVVEKNNVVCFVESNNDKLINGMFLYYMYNTQGIPYDISKDLLEEKGFEVDEEGFNILYKTNQDLSKGTFLNKDAFS